MVGAHSPSQVKTRRRTWATATILTRLSTGLGRRHARFSLAETPLTSQSPTLGSPFQKTRFPKDSMSTLTGALSVTNKMSRGRESNERSSLYDNSPPYYHRIRSVRVDDSHSLLGARLRLVAFESTTRQGTAPFMATGLCNYWTHRSERPGSAFYPVLDPNWSERRTARPMGALGRPYFLYCCTMRPCRKGSGPLVPSLLLNSFVRSLFPYLS